MNAKAIMMPWEAHVHRNQSSIHAPAIGLAVQNQNTTEKIGVISTDGGVILVMATAAVN